jgi:transposase-like protein
MHSSTAPQPNSNLNVDMVFGSSSKRKRADEKEDDDVQVVHEVPVDIQDGGADADSGDEDGAAATGTKHPLLDEINIIGVPSGKNVGGTKEWQCKHCKKSYKGSLTRVRVHLLGPLPGKKAQIARCMSLQNDPNKSKALREKVKEADSKGFHMRSTSGTTTPNPLTKSFGVAQRESVDMEITKFLCANGIPFNVLRSPQFSQMIMAIKNGPKDYKGPSSEKARTTLLDACKRSVETDLAPLKSTW